MKYLFLCYPKCTTCQKAKKWLNDNGIEYGERHIVEQNPTDIELKQWYVRSKLPLKKFFNTNGYLYRSMKLAEKLPIMTANEQIALLASDGMLIKRPLIVNDTVVLVGFKPTEWEQLK
jgi:arsenate reductase